MNDWADAAAAKLRDKEEGQRIKDAKFVEEQRIKKARGTPLWHEVRKLVKQNCEDINRNMGRVVLTFEVVPNSEISIRADIGGKHEWVKASFDENQGLLEWNSDNKWFVSVTENGGIGFYWGMVPTTPDSIARQLCNAALGI